MYYLECLKRRQAVYAFVALGYSVNCALDIVFGE